MWSWFNAVMKECTVSVDMLKSVLMSIFKGKGDALETKLPRL